MARIEIRDLPKDLKITREEMRKIAGGSSGNGGLQDFLLTKMENMKDKPLSVQDTMRLQYELMQLNMQQELTTKVADKTTQGVQTLFKNQ